MGFEFDHEKIPLYKLVLHIAQIVLSVTIWCLEIAVFKGGHIYGDNGWTFGVVCLPATATSVQPYRDHLSLTLALQSSAF